MNENFQLHRDRFGHLVLTESDGREHLAVEPTRAFPISAPQEGIAVLSREGHELAWIARVADLTEQTRRLLEDELAGREFMPEIRQVRGVSGYATPCTWQVETDRGGTSLVLHAEEDIRRLAAPALLIVDSRGIQFLIRDPRALDATSRKILDRFL
ncbi:MAG: DUF1854 domain-containing protein [Verrucomicrobia bacterium]|nr:DUF1854 domain-containing protein [Verrucomicrobiota bacterium]